MNKYQWRIKSFAKGIDPDKAIQELEIIEQRYGALTAENILNHSKFPDSVLHKLFEWDDSKAATQYRLHQARTLLNNVQVVVISDGSEKTINVFEVVKSKTGNVYKNIATFNEDDIAQVRARTVRELNYLKNKLDFYKEFQKASNKIQEAIESLL